MNRLRTISCTVVLVLITASCATASGELILFNPQIEEVVELPSTAIGVGNTTADLNGDGRTDYAVVRNSASGLTWFWNETQTPGFKAAPWGLIGDTLLLEDFDGDGKDDITIWRAGVSVSTFCILQSTTLTARIEAFGILNDDATVVGDYDGDGKADLAVYRAGTLPGQQSMWFYRGTLNNPSGNITFIPWGTTGDRVSPGDYDGDGKHDFVIRRDGGPQSIFWQLLSSGSVVATGFGISTDFIVPGDYDGDGKTDLTALRTNGITLSWYYLPSGGGASFREFIWGTLGDQIAQGDYDGDGKTDPAVWRIDSTAGTFWSRNSSNGAPRVFQFGGSNDLAVVHSYNRH